MKRVTGVGLAVAAGLAIAASVANAAPIVDDLDDAANISGPFNGIQAVDNPDGTVTVQRTAASAVNEAGIDWYASKISLTPDHNYLEINPTALNNGGGFQVNVLFFDVGGTYLGEPAIGGDHYTADPVIVADVAGIAPANAVSYFVRFRIIPWHLNAEEPGVVLTRIMAIPEPAAASLLCLGGVMLLGRKRS